ncbi:MAG TPA: hypothetical protein VEQ84_07040 [Vicinamibacteria bacterium]|nr:hypothetical protein [Vicinamibacteria bacterium]
MQRLEGSPHLFVFDRPVKRPLKIYASDPMAGRTVGNRARVEIDNEPLRPGPQGRRVEVIDYDGEAKRFYPPVDLDDPNVLMQGGLDPTESDPRFHQQMVYAVAMRTLENFDRALGRTLYVGQRDSKRLRLFPHAFYGANAYYDRKLNGILFGYFRADENDPGPNLPGQTVFTCLSHDIVAHEMTHAIVDRLRRFFMEPTNVDVFAFHEGFADIVALFQHFSFPDVVRDQIQKTRTDIRDRSALVDLARQFGYATGSGSALRSALDKPERKLYETVIEPHARGSILVAAVFDAFHSVYQRRIRDLIRIATGGTGQLPQGDLHPDLVNRVAAEASRAAQGLLSMCIRAFDYLPPVDITFGDFVRALVTADLELSPEDEYGQRAAMIEAFRLRNIFPDGVGSLAEESLVWDAAPPRLKKLDMETADMLRELFMGAATFSFEDDPSENVEQAQNRFQEHFSGRRNDELPSDDGTGEVDAEMASALGDWAKENSADLGLQAGVPIQTRGFHPAFRVAPNGKLLIELVAQFVQTDKSRKEDLGGLPVRGGTTIVAAADGRIRYVIKKPLPAPGASPDTEPRLARQLAYVELADSLDARTNYYGGDDFKNRMNLRMRLGKLHQGASR